MRNLMSVYRAILPLAMMCAGSFSVANDGSARASVEGVVSKVVQATGRVTIGNFSCVVDRQSALEISHAKALNTDANVVAALTLVQVGGSSDFCVVKSARLEKLLPIVNTEVATSAALATTGNIAGLGGSGISGLGGSGISGLGGSGISGLGGSGISGLGGSGISGLGGSGISGLGGSGISGLGGSGISGLGGSGISGLGGSGISGLGGSGISGLGGSGISGLGGSGISGLGGSGISGLGGSGLL